jgi:hypothetical protein
MTKTKEAQVKLLRVKELSFSCTDISNDLDNETIEKNLQIEIGFNFNINKKEKEFCIETLVQYVIENKEALKYENQTIFKVLNINEVAKTVGDKIKIKDEFLLSLLSIVIGTTRGMMIKNTMGKKINEFPLPIINPGELLDNIKKKK